MWMLPRSTHTTGRLFGHANVVSASDGVTVISTPRRLHLTPVWLRFLYRYAGEPGVNLPEQSLYADMTADSPFYRESTWLKKKGLVFWSESWFQPDGAVTRADFAELIYQYEQGK